MSKSPSTPLSYETITELVRDLKTMRLSSREGILTVTGTTRDIDLSAIPEVYHEQIITGVNALKFLAGTRKKMSLPEALRALMYGDSIHDHDPVITTDDDKNSSLSFTDLDTDEYITVTGPTPLINAIYYARSGLVEFIKSIHAGYVHTALN